MKTKYVIIGFLMMVMSFTGYTQIGGSVFDNVMETDESKSLRKTLDFFSKSFTDVDAETMEVRCLMLIANHAESLVKIQEQIESASNCKKAKELLGYQSLILLSGGTKIFCADEFNSDKLYYAKSIEEIRINGDYGELESEKISDCNDKFADARDKFGNPYYEEIQSSLADLSKLKKHIEEMKVNGTEEELSEADKEFLDFTEEDWENLKTKKIYENRIDIITYWISPQFMAKRAEEIDSMIRSLPCN